MSTSEYSKSGYEGGGSTQVDADAVARAKREIQNLVQEIAELSRSGIEPAQFYEGMLGKVVAALAAPGGAVWMVGEQSGLQLAYQINLQQTGLIENQQGQTQHARLLHRVMQGDDGAIVAPHSGEGGESDADEDVAANPTDFLLVLAPVKNDQGVQGVIEVFQRAGARPATQRGYLRFLLQVCELAGDYLRHQRLEHLSGKQSLWEQLESFTRLVHEKLDLRQSAYTIVNEGRRLVGCDRISVAIQKGRKCPLEAISGQDTFDKRANTTTLLSKLAAAVTKTGEDVWYTGDTTDLAPQVEQAIDAYVDESHTKAMAILPLFEPQDETDLREEQQAPNVIGALIVEQMVDSRLPDGFRQRVEVVRSHSSSAIHNALEHEGLFLMPLWKRLGKATALFRGSALPKTLAVLTAIATLIACGMLIQTDFTLEGSGRLRPIQRRNVFANLMGEIEQVHVTHDQVVKAGDVLIRQRSIDLEEQVEVVRGQVETVLAEIASVNQGLHADRRVPASEREQASARLAQLQKEIASLRERQSLLKEKIKKLTVVSPIDGRVVTWKVQELLLGRPVQPGERLLEIADPSGAWELEVLMPESRMGSVTEAWNEAEGELEVTFILSTDPSDRFTGKVKEIGISADVRGEEGNTVLMRVEFDQERLREVIGVPQVNAEAIVKVHCGRASFGYVWLHDLIDAFKKHILFRFLT